MLLKTNDSCSHVIKKFQARDNFVQFDLWPADCPHYLLRGKTKTKKQTFILYTESKCSLISSNNIRWTEVPTGRTRQKFPGEGRLSWTNKATSLFTYVGMISGGNFRMKKKKKKSINSAGGMCERREEGRARANKRLLTASRPRAVGLTDLIDVHQAPPPLVSIGRWSARKETHGGWRKVQMREFPSSSAGTTSPPASSAVLVISKQIEKCPPVLANCQTFNSPRQN